MLAHAPRRPQARQIFNARQQMKHATNDQPDGARRKLSGGALAAICIGFFLLLWIPNSILLKTSGDLPEVQKLVSAHKEWFPDFVYIYGITPEENVSGTHGRRGIVNWRSDKSDGFYTFSVAGYHAYKDGRFVELDHMYVRVSYIKNSGYVTKLGLMEKRSFLFSEYDNDWPNKTSVPTAVAITTAADAPVVPTAAKL